MSSTCETLQSITLLCTALCTAGLLYTAHHILRTLRTTAHQLLDFAAELLDLIDPVLPAQLDLASPPPVASAHVDFFEDAAHPGWNTPLSPVPSSAPSSPLRELPLFSLDKELRAPPRAPCAAGAGEPAAELPGDAASDEDLCV